MPALLLQYPQIDPVIFEIGPLVIRWYALAYIAGLLLAMVYMKRLVRDRRLWPGEPAITAGHIDDFLLWAALGVILGGRIGYVLFYNLRHFIANPAEVFAVWQGGMSFHGGFLGVIVAVIIFCRANRLNPLTLLDLSAAAVPIGLFFGRIANFINGELFGRPTDVPWAMVFPHGGPEPRHPSQLYEAALEGIALFLVLRFATHRLKLLARPGHVAGLFAIGYGVSRIAVEFVRDPDAHIGYFAGWLTMGMILSLPMLAVGAALVLNARRGRA
jgi:phosphatidylglycerol---prolipoprotein diacylglyceryl transferase